MLEFARENSGQKAFQARLGFDIALEFCVQENQLARRHSGKCLDQRSGKEFKRDHRRNGIPGEAEKITSFIG